MTQEPQEKHLAPRAVKVSWRSFPASLMVSSSRLIGSVMVSGTAFLRAGIALLVLASAGLAALCAMRFLPFSVTISMAYVPSPMSIIMRSAARYGSFSLIIELENRVA